MEEQKPLAGLWRKNPETPEGKYLIKRRDGTVPEWPSLVLGAKDPAAPAAINAYADAAFGDYAEGRYGWITDTLYQLPSPIPFRARQGLCNVDNATIRQIMLQGWKP